MAQEIDNVRYNSKHEAEVCSVGDLVLIFTAVRKVGLSEKLMKRYFGPFKVTRESIDYEIKSAEPSGWERQKRDLGHILRMKPYHDPADKVDLFNPCQLSLYCENREEQSERGECSITSLHLGRLLTVLTVYRQSWQRQSGKLGNVHTKKRRDTVVLGKFCEQIGVELSSERWI
ncbi:hypothetical protein LAZ67_3002659 [Cordylochernes scorpioides]|uniref:Uncharacterized protein n=1 Tax=Cordylochernes scorpioides TaxID=51811 RepID=A0ABY6K8Z7_9ARAC|nr:hypothetical protein LAZ67_3002659 [Cordylochernes scorpioides]